MKSYGKAFELGNLISAKVTSRVQNTHLLLLGSHLFMWNTLSLLIIELIPPHQMLSQRWGGAHSLTMTQGLQFTLQLRTRGFTSSLQT